MLSKQQSKYFAYELTRLDKTGKLGGFSQALLDAQVDINPHQIEAASFAIQSPLTKGVVLADEVGLRKPSKPVLYCVNIGLRGNGIY